MIVKYGKNVNIRMQGKKYSFQRTPTQHNIIQSRLAVPKEGGDYG